MPDLPTVVLRARTADDLDVMFSIAADLDNWEERTPTEPAPLTRERWDARTALAAESATPDGLASFVIEADGSAVGTVSLFRLDSFVRHAEAGARSPRSSPRTPEPSAPTRTRDSSSRVDCANTGGFAGHSKTAC